MTAHESSQGPAEVAVPRSAERNGLLAVFLRQPFTWLIALVGLAFAILPVWGDNVQLRESLSVSYTHLTLPTTPYV